MTRIKQRKKRFFHICGRNEAQSHKTCRGTIPVADATVQEHGARSFVVSCNRRAYYLRASSAADRDRWVRSIRVATSQTRITKPCREWKHFVSKSNNYVRQGRYVIPGVCLSVCLILSNSVCLSLSLFVLKSWCPRKITRKRAVLGLTFYGKRPSNFGPLFPRLDARTWGKVSLSSVLWGRRSKKIRKS